MLKCITGEARASDVQPPPPRLSKHSPITFSHTHARLLAALSTTVLAALSTSMLGLHQPVLAALSNTVLADLSTPMLGLHQPVLAPITFGRTHARLLSAFTCFVAVGNSITFAAGGSSDPSPVLMRCFLSA